MKPPAFIIGVWAQPVASFPTWRARGCNTVVGTVYGPGTGAADMADYIRQAKAAGFYTIAAHADADAFDQIDEPDGKGIPFEQIQTTYKQAKADNPARPVFLNLDGSRIPWTPAAVRYQYAQGCDWICFDYYPLNRGDGLTSIVRIGQYLDTIKADCPGKKYLVFIESSDQDLRISDWLAGTAQGLAARGPTPLEQAQEVEVAIAHGADGIVYFPDVIGKGWETFDGTQPLNAAMMVQQAAKYTPATVLLPPLNPADPATVKPLPVHSVLIDGVPYAPYLTPPN